MTILFRKRWIYLTRITFLHKDKTALHFANADVRANESNGKTRQHENQFITTTHSKSIRKTKIIRIYFPKDWLWPCPLALKPKKGLAEAVPRPDEKVDPPLMAEAVATPVEETPPGPALPVPNPAPLPDPILGKPTVFFLNHS